MAKEFGRWHNEEHITMLDLVLDEQDDHLQNITQSYEHSKVYYGDAETEFDFIVDECR